MRFRKLFARQLLMVWICLCLAVPTFAQTPSRSPSPPQLELPRRLLTSPTSNTEVQVGEVHLDGYRLFAIASPIAQNSSQTNTTTPVSVRVRGIEAALSRLVTAAELNVRSAIDASSNLPVISINNQYLMTVTTLDAELQGQDPETYANQLVETIRSALVRAKQERQPDYLMRQGVSAIAIVVAMVITSLAVRQLQRRIRARYERMKLEVPTVTPTSEPSAGQTHLMVRRQLNKRQQLNFKDVQRRLLQLFQVAIWFLGSLTILGLFPYSRWLQPIVLSTPLKVLGILFATYVLIRISDVLIDRFFDVFESGAFISPEASQRFALRVSTFARVAKGMAAIALVSSAILFTLAIVGIQLIPLLAGAGIVGLGISLASQSLIKDIINGFLILLEDQYAVGDVIQVGKVSGLVETLNLRITQLRNAEGRLITIPNSSITVVENLSKDWSRVDLAIVLSSDTNLDRAMQLIQQVGNQMSQETEWRSEILEPPEVLGVDDLTSTGVTIRIWIKTQPLQQWKVAREFRRRLKMALDREGVEIGVPQQVLSLQEPQSDRPFPNGTPFDRQ